MGGFNDYRFTNITWPGDKLKNLLFFCWNIIDIYMSYGNS